MSLAALHALFERVELPWPVATCKSCPARIVWTETTNATAMPVDADGDAAGNVIVEAASALFGDEHTPVSRALPKDTPPQASAWDGTRLRTVSHFATCPDRDKHRKART